MKTLHAIALTLGLAGAALAIPSAHGTAQAFPATGYGVDLSLGTSDNAPLYTVVDNRKYKWRYNWRHHGPRYYNRRPGFNFYYGGFYYAQPWWGMPAYSAPYYSAPRRVYMDDSDYGSGHVDWCLNRYRSYDPGSDTFMGYDGYRHRCISPYD